MQCDCREEHTFMMGAQKCTVLGPTLEFHSCWNLLCAISGATTVSAALAKVRCWVKRMAGWRKEFMARKPRRAVVAMLKVVGRTVYPGVRIEDAAVMVVGVGWRSSAGCIWVEGSEEAFGS